MYVAMLMRFEWDENKNRQNLRKHDVRFQTAALVFEDSYTVSRHDPAFEDEDRWITIGAVGPGLILLVVHTFRDEHDEEVIRIIWRVPPSHMKGNSMTKLTKDQKRDIRAIAAKRDRDIDFSDSPPVIDWSGAEIGKFYRPEKKPVTMRLDSDIIEWLKADGRGYQTKANRLLRHAMFHFKMAGSLNRSDRLSGRAKAKET
jgi:uncharacterized DUF497 family protein/uncharacterized protein (DUF4415 family)